MAIRMVAVSFDGVDANPNTVRTFLGATCQALQPSGERTDRLAMLIENQPTTTVKALTAPTEK